MIFYVVSDIWTDDTLHILLLVRFKYLLGFVNADWERTVGLTAAAFETNNVFMFI